MRHSRLTIANFTHSISMHFNSFCLAKNKLPRHSEETAKHPTGVEAFPDFPGPEALRICVAL